MLSPIQTAIAAIKSAPRMPNGGINWSHDKTVMAKIAIAILSATSSQQAIADITAATGVKSWTMRYFIKGRNVSNGVETTVIKAIKDAGLSPVAVKGRRQNRGAATPPAADAIAPAAFEVRATPPVADPPAVKAQVLAVTANGNVSPTTLPPAALAPSPMAATPGDFATKSNTTRCVLDTKTNDILVITTRRIEFRSPEWCDKMVDINSKPRA